MFVRFSSQGAWERFSVDGNCIVPVFKWLIESPVMKSVTDEFDMYLHHNQSDRTGEARSYHSVLEQAIWQNPIYYALLVAARPDLNHHQLSVSYSRYMLPGDKCQYRQIDLDVQNALDRGIGLKNIQSSVSFDQEVSEGCTAVVLGFQNHLADWWARAVARGDARPGNTCQKSMFTSRRTRNRLAKNSIKCVPPVTFGSLSHTFSMDLLRVLMAKPSFSDGQLACLRVFEETPC